jgi:hypothetical protein
MASGISCISRSRLEGPPLGSRAAWAVSAPRSGADYSHSTCESNAGAKSKALSAFKPICDARRAIYFASRRANPARRSMFPQARSGFGKERCSINII